MLFSELAWDVYRWWVYISLFLIVCLVLEIRKDVADYKLSLKVYFGIILVLLVWFTVIFIHNLKDEYETQQRLRYDIKDCLDKDRTKTYKQCEEISIDRINFFNDNAPTGDDYSPSYR